jgi:hypothetical protein
VSRVVVRLTVAVLVAAAAGVGAPGQAQAAACGTAHGVTVVVDFHQLGGGVQTACDPGGGGHHTSTQLTDVGHVLTYAQRQPGFVCRVDGSPSSDPCINTSPADAYWSLWWSDGKSGTWSYASSGVASLKVPAGGYVALSWQKGNAQARPGVSPKPHGVQPTSSPTSRPPSSPHPSHGPTGAPSSSTAPGAPTTSPAAPTSGPSASRHPHHSKPTHSQHSSAPKPSSDASDGSHAVGPAADVSDGSGGSGGSGSGGLPVWVAPVAIAALFVGVGTITLLRRKSSGGV